LIAVDTSVAVARFASWHEAHDAARRALGETAVLIGHCALEAYSVLTRLPSPHRAPGDLVYQFLERQFPAAPLLLDPDEQRRLPGRMVALGITGGAVYEAFVALTASADGATLVSLDRRAMATYQRCGVAARFAN